LQEAEESLDSAILDGFMYGHFDTLMKIVEADPRCVNYAASFQKFKTQKLVTKLFFVLLQHSERKVTPLMAAAGQGDIEVLEKLLNLGADPGKRSPNGWTAKDFALKTRQSEAVRVLEAST
jgi:ankyrin repeat protein